jgi:hypothetical protein
MKTPNIWGDKFNNKRQLPQKSLDELAELKKEIKAITDKKKKREAKEASESVKQMTMEEKNTQEATNKGKKGPNAVVSMTPIFSRRSMLVLLLGLIVGLGLGLGYWAFSPASVVIEEAPPPAPSGGFLQSLGIGPPPPIEPWRSEVSIQIVNPGSTFITIGQLANIGVYYAAKTESLPFLQFLSLDLAKSSPLYNHTVAELDSIINTTYDARAEQPTIRLQVTTPTADEASFLAGRIPEVFQAFLIAEENNQRVKTRENILVSIEDVKKAIIESEREVSILQAQGISSIDKDPTYIALATRVTALQLELERQANIIVIMTYQGYSDNSSNIKQEYEKALKDIEQVKADILIAAQEANTLAGQRSNTDIRNDPSYLILTAEVTSLQTRINTIMNGGIDTETGLQKIGLAEMIAGGINSGPVYEDAQLKLEAASKALSDGLKKLAIMQRQSGDVQIKLSLDYQMAQANVDALNQKFTALLLKLRNSNSENFTDTQASFERTSATLAKARQDLASIEGKLISNQLPRDLDYQVAQAKVNTLKSELSTLNNSLSTTFVNTGGALQAINSLAVGNPSTPLIVFPDRIQARTALAVGAILGLLIAWAVLNRKWLIKTFIPSGQQTESE